MVLKFSNREAVPMPEEEGCPFHLTLHRRSGVMFDTRFQRVIHGILYRRVVFK